MRRSIRVHALMITLSGWNDVNKLQWNNLQRNASTNVMSGASPLAAPTDPGLRVGKSGTSVTGENRLEKFESAWNFQVSTSETSRKDYAELLEWFDDSGSLIAASTGIEATIDLAVESQEIDYGSFVTALADTAEEVPKGSACTAPDAPTLSARLVRMVSEVADGAPDGQAGAGKVEGARERDTEVTLPTKWELGPAVPNPARGGLRVAFAVPVQPGAVQIAVYNVEGRARGNLGGGWCCPWVPGCSLGWAGRYRPKRGSGRLLRSDDGTRVCRGSQSGSSALKRAPQ